MGNCLRFYIWFCHAGKVSQCSMTMSLHCPDRQFYNCKSVDRMLAFGNFFSEKFFLLMQYAIIFSPKYGHQHIHKCTLYQKRRENTDWCSRDSMQFIHLRSLGSISSAGEKSRNVAWKAWKPHWHTSCSAATLPNHKAKISLLVRSVQSGAGIRKSGLFSIMVIKLHLPFILHVAGRSM